MGKMFYRNRYSPYGAFLRVPLFSLIGYSIGFMIGISSIPGDVSEYDFKQLIGMYVTLGFCAGLAGGALNEVRLARRPR
jgi:hypothetical protein